MKFLVYRSTQGAVSKDPPCPGAVRGPESPVWPGEYPWFVEIGSLDDLLTFLQANGGALGLFTAEEDEEHPAIEIFDDEDADED